MENEIWKDVVGYEGLYQVSNIGRVKSLERVNSRGNTVKEKILKVGNGGGYLRVSLCKKGKSKSYNIHKLVALAFIPNPENKPCVDHINTKKDDNRVENLRWVTHKENNNNLLTKTHLSEASKGKVMSEEARRKMSENNHNKKGVYCEGVFFSSVKECAEFYNISYSTMINWLIGNNPMPQEWYDRGLRYEDKQMSDYKVQNSEEHRRKISEAMKGKYTGRNSCKAKKVYCGRIIFNSIGECAEFYNISYSALYHWLKGERKKPQKFVELGLRFATPEDLETLQQVA